MNHVYRFAVSDCHIAADFRNRIRFLGVDVQIGKHACALRLLFRQTQRAVLLFIRRRAKHDGRNAGYVRKFLFFARRQQDRQREEQTKSFHTIKTFDGRFYTSCSVISV